jgi:GR25 family glycosyltransferase involved in LPS biosynthesis
MVWTIIKHAGHEMAIVFEDDVLPCPDFSDKLEQVIADLPADWDLVYLGWLDSHPRVKKHISGNVYKMQIGFPFGTHALLVRDRGIQTLLDTNRICQSHIDLQLARRSLDKLNWYVVYPSVVRQRTQSTAGNEYWPTAAGIE